MFETELTTILKELANEFKLIIRFQLSKIGLPTSYSNITEDLFVDYKNNTLQVFMYDYYKYIESGRKPKAKKVPIRAIIKWLTDKKKNLRPRNSKGKFVKINSVAFAIQNAIYKNGIKGRKFMEDASEELFKKFSDEIDELIIEGVLDQMIIRELKRKK